MAGVWSKLMFEAETRAGWVVVVEDEVIDLSWDRDTWEVSVGGGIYAPGRAICWVLFAGHVVCENTPGGGTQAGENPAEGGIGCRVPASTFSPGVDDPLIVSMNR